MTFVEISIYQVKPDRKDDFESIMNQAVEQMQTFEGCQLLRLVHRTHYIKAMDTIKEGLPADKLTRTIKCIKYALYWEFDTNENYGNAQKTLYETYWKSIEKCLIAPHDKILGERIK
ncbi:hypothetical protein [Enterococcus ureasiticus]|uniref:Uncharacterized protein n=1 Tax=Enterococcus ureasiticus TaxID=903984 RepID=A0A1E5GGQ5_9ENTE|nr:hypothetical protein [Enterococcus ureasiticus]OEG11913.1 hypothetical protein BCR21_06670 [Enterococcus ureasiticus]